MLALDARAALEIGITQTLGDCADRSRPSARRSSPACGRSRRSCAARAPRTCSRYIRADDAFHRIFFSLLRNPALFEIYNAMDVPELMRRVLEVAPPSIREVFDDHKGLTDALRSGDANATAAAITEHANRVRPALAAFVADGSPRRPARAGGG